MSLTAAPRTFPVVICTSSAGRPPPFHFESPRVSPGIRWAPFRRREPREIMGDSACQRGVDAPVLLLSLGFDDFCGF